MQKLNNPLRKIVVVFKTHFDFGFTGLPDEVMSLYAGEMFSAVRRVMDATAAEPEGLRYAWTLPSWPLKYLLHDPLVPPETQRAAHDLVTQGRLHWHAWPFTTHTAFCGLEELVRGLHFSRSLAEEFGRGTIAAKQTDVPGHTWILPMLLTGAGVKFLHLGVNPGSHSPHVPTLFWWEGPDGSRLLTWYSHGGYGSTLLPPDDWPLDTWLAVLLTVENTGPQSPKELEQIRAFIATNAPGVEVVFGQLDDFAHSVLVRPEQLASLPVVPYDLADTWIHGIGTMPREVARARALRQKILELECIAACQEWPNDKQRGNKNQPDFPLSRQISHHIDSAYEQLLMFGEHTWGLDVKSTIKRAFGSEFEVALQTEPYRRLEASWVAKAEYISEAEAAYSSAETIVRETWRNWSQSPEVQKRRTERDALLHIPQDHLIETYVQDNLRASDSAIGNPTVLEDGNLRVEVDPASGGIISLRDISSGREWVDSSTNEPFGGYRYDIYSSEDIAGHLRAYGRLFQDWFIQDFGKSGYPEDVPHVTAYARDFQVSHVFDEGGEALLMSGGTLKATGPGAELLPEQEVSIRISLGTFIELEYTITGKKATPLAESTIVPFPIQLPKATFRLGQVGSVIDPARDIVEGANRNLWCADWVDVSDDRSGMAVRMVSMPLVSIGDTGIYKFEPERVPTIPIVYAHLSNTQWGTNFQQWHRGDFAFTVILMPHIGDWRAGNVWKSDLAHHSDLRDLQPVGEHGICDLSYNIRWSEGLALQGIRPRHNGPGLIVRFWDALGLGRREIIKVAGPVARAWRCDLMEQPIEQLRTVRHAESDDPNEPLTWIITDLAPHAIVTLLIEFDIET